MTKRESISRYSLILKKLRKSPATFKEISDYLALESELQSYNYTISFRTFQRDLKDIESLYNIEIRYDFSKKTYFIEYEGEPEANERILEAFDTFNALNITEGLSKYIHFEQRRPQGTENLYGLLHAIKNCKKIGFDYQKFWEESATRRNVEPLALKEFKSRWYLIANDLNDNQIKTFGLDRLTELTITNQPFEYPNFSIKEYFKHCFGIIRGVDGEPQEIILSFKAFQGKYIITFPLHESQQILVDDDNELRIKFLVYITYDLIMELLSYGNSLTVIQPETLIRELAESR
jgi:predicted DNA-binding transcriptional regulator YafY